MESIRIAQLEAAINRARAAQPAVGAESALSADVAVLAGIYGRMIHHRLDQLSIDELDEPERRVAERWLGQPSGSPGA
ncbi:MAG: DUF3717 domain-containing protein [Burkholderiaceae bacterium]